MKPSNAFTEGLTKCKRRAEQPALPTEEQPQPADLELDRKFRKALKFFAKYAIEKRAICKFMGVGDSVLGKKMAGERKWKKEEKIKILDYVNSLKEGILSVEK